MFRLNLLSLNLNLLVSHLGRGTAVLVPPTLAHIWSDKACHSWIVMSSFIWKRSARTFVATASADGTRHQEPSEFLRDRRVVRIRPIQPAVPRAPRGSRAGHLPARPDVLARPQDPPALVQPAAKARSVPRGPCPVHETPGMSPPRRPIPCAARQGCPRPTVVRGSRVWRLSDLPSISWTPG